MIRRLDAKNYGCLRDVNIASLTPLHAFIGPNDSGKSTILRAVRVLSAFASGAPQGPSHPFEMQLDWDRPSQPRVELRGVTPLGAYNVKIQAGQPPMT